MQDVSKSWQSDAMKFIRQSIDSIDDFVDAKWRSLNQRFGWEGKPAIQAYVGYANNEHAWFHGRVLTNHAIAIPSLNDGWWENLLEMYRRFESDEVPNVEVEIEFGGMRHRVKTDEEGYFHLETKNLDLNVNQLPWKSITMRIVNHHAISGDESVVVSQLSTPPRSAKLGVISDIDDTVLHTGITDLLTAARLTFLHNATTRKPLPGVGALYRAIRAGANNEKPQHNPVFYVSSSPWNLFDLLEDFLRLNDIPAGPILLRDIGFDQNKFLKEGHEHKLEKVRKLLTVYPNLPFVLFGDSGQEDASLYLKAAQEFPHQIKAIFIRDVDPRQTSKRDTWVSEAVQSARELGVPMSLVKDSLQCANTLNKLGWLNDNQVKVIENATRLEASI